MTPYQKLCAAIDHHGGIATAWELRHELKAYLQQFKVVAKTPEGRVIDWQDLYTKDEYHALVNGVTKSKRRCKSCKSKPCQCGERSVNTKGQIHIWKEPDIKRIEEDFAGWIDEYRRQQQEESDNDSYHGSF